MRYLHAAWASHTRLEKAGIGVIVLCTPRLPLPRRKTHGWFRPDLDGAGWHKLNSPKDITVFAGADDALHAMALLRAAQEGKPADG